jgi:hypothetical protein
MSKKDAIQKRYDFVIFSMSKTVTLTEIRTREIYRELMRKQGMD